MACRLSCSETGPLESRMIGNGHVRFGGGPLEKVLTLRNLAGGLSYPY